MRRRLAVPVLAVLALLALLVHPAPSSALLVTYTVGMSGDQVVPSGTGDPDGSANGTITLNDVTGEITFSFFFASIHDPGSMHIHPGAAGAEGGALVTLPVDAIYADPNPLVGSVMPFLSTVQSIIANPTAFYVDIHTPPFPDGAVRGQLGSVVPEPSVAWLAAVLAGIALARRR